MKALVYQGPRNVQVLDMPDPKIEDPHDVIIKVTSTNICGSDLHMYEGRTTLEKGRIIGHENLGVADQASAQGGRQATAASPVREREHAEAKDSGGAPSRDRG